MSGISNHYCSILKHCCESRNLRKAKELHCHLLRTIIDAETFLLNNLADAYGKLGCTTYARNVFDEMCDPNTYSWNIILSAYSKSGELGKMHEVFDQMSVKDGASWNAVISGYGSRGLGKEAVMVYMMMLESGRLDLNRITMMTLLKIASSQGGVGFGRQIHGHVVKFGFEGYTFVGCPLMDMYSKAGLLGEAKLVFDVIPERNLVMYNNMITGLLRCATVEDAKRLFDCMEEKDSISWTSMITGLMQNGLHQESVDMFRDMRDGGFAMDQFTFGSALTACGGMLVLKEGKQIHGYSLRTDHMDNVYVGSALVDLYCKCCCINYAEEVFKRMYDKNVISWTALIVGYGQNGFSEDALRVFCEMQRSGVDPDEYTIGSVMSSCGNLASLEEGTQFHCQALVSGLVSFLTVSNALVTLYGKCGSIEESNKLFNEMYVKDAVTWTALISGYAQFGKANETIALFENMLSAGLKPDGVTFVGLLSACSRAGLVEKGQEYFESMSEEHGISLTTDHYTCMIDLLSRAGRLEQAKDFIDRMPYAPDSIGWATLLSSCRFHKNVEIGKWAADHLVKLEPNNPASYVLLTSIYAAEGKWEYVAQLRRGMRDLQVKKEPGFSWIKYMGKVHVFSADDMSSHFSDQIYNELEKLNVKMIQEGYLPDMNYALHDVEEAEKVRMLNHHSEKLAIAFGLLFIPRGLPIRVVKNLRVCGDCHNATKFISKITQREILVRDSARYHLFKNGTCSCGDFW
ncbi:hypothetical protein QQ045_018872 [Rhodiola kirilowii]